jgi:ATP-dependent Clp protease protease subunit
MQKQKKELKLKMNWKEKMTFNGPCAEEILGEVMVNLGEVANLKLPDPGLVDYYTDLKERVYRLNTQVDDPLLELINLIIKWNKEDRNVPVEQRKPIKVFINSPGGDCVVAWAVIQAIRTSKTPVWTICAPYAYSAAADILVSGHKRFTLKGGQCMFHTGSGFYGGEQSTIESAKKHNDKLLKKMKEFVLANTKIPVRTYNTKASSDIWYDDEDMLKLGIVDVVVEDFEEIY